MSISGYLKTASVIAALSLGACASMPSMDAPKAAPVVAHTPGKTLVGTWQLVAFQPNDTGSPAIKPPAPDTYEVTFQSNGRAIMKIDCNHASAIWETTLTDGTHGSLTFGPLAMTRMACPNPGLGTNWGLDANSVADYTVNGDTLSLGLQGGKGVYSWKRKVP